MLTKHRLKIFNKFFILIMALIFTMVLFSHNPGKIFAAQSGLSILNVRTSRTSLIPGEDVTIFYRLTESAGVTILVYDPDYSVVRKLANGLSRPGGTNNIIWDGRDDAGEMVPDEAYIFSIAAKGKNGQYAVYDPTSRSGGEILYLKMDRVIKADGNYTMYYSIPVPSRICIRAGIHKGPMLKTILEWTPFPPGDYTKTWDGMDETGRIKVMDDPDSILYIKGFKLPENVIIVQKSNPDYQSYHNRLPAGSSFRTGIITKSSVKRAAIGRRNKGIASEYLVSGTLNIVPEFTVYPSQNVVGNSSGRTAAGVVSRMPLAENGITDVSGIFNLTIELSPDSLESFNESRYEIVVFVDNKRFDEEETAYSPYTYSLDTSNLSDGEHEVAINMISLTGQAGTYSFTINVNNKNHSEVVQ